MKNITKTQWYALGIISITIILRSFINIPNFSPMLGASVVAGMFISGPLAFIVPIVSMISSDLILFIKQLGTKNATDFLGWMSYQPVIYVLMALSVMMGIYGKKFLTVSYMRHVIVGTGTGLASSILFFVLSNLMVWVDPWGWQMYTKDLAGFVQCYIMAIPFAIPTFVSTLLFVPTFMFLYLFGYKRIEYAKSYTLKGIS